MKINPRYDWGFLHIKYTIDFFHNTYGIAFELAEELESHFENDYENEDDEDLEQQSKHDEGCKG